VGIFPVPFFTPASTTHAFFFLCGLFLRQNTACRHTRTRPNTYARSTLLFCPLYFMRGTLEHE